MFPVRSATGKKYIFVLQHYDKNNIQAPPIKSRHTNHISQTWKTIFDTLKHHSETPELQILDDECFSKTIHSFKSFGATYQLVPPHLYWRNAAERVIMTLKKNHCKHLYIPPQIPLIILRLSTATSHHHPQPIEIIKTKSIIFSSRCGVWAVQF